MSQRTILLLAAMALSYTGMSLAETNKMFNKFSSDLGGYTEYRISGYNIQPNRPGVWKRGCRTDNYYCTAQLEYCMGHEGRAVPVQQPAILQNHR